MSGKLEHDFSSDVSPEEAEKENSNNLISGNPLIEPDLGRNLIARCLNKATVDVIKRMPDQQITKILEKIPLLEIPKKLTAGIRKQFDCLAGLGSKSTEEIQTPPIDPSIKSEKKDPIPLIQEKIQELNTILSIKQKNVLAILFAARNEGKSTILVSAGDLAKDGNIQSLGSLIKNLRMKMTSKGLAIINIRSYGYGLILTTEDTNSFLPFLLQPKSPQVSEASSNKIPENEFVVIEEKIKSLISIIRQKIKIMGIVLLLAENQGKKQENNEQKGISLSNIQSEMRIYKKGESALPDQRIQFVPIGEKEDESSKDDLSRTVTLLEATKIEQLEPCLSDYGLKLKTAGKKGTYLQESENGEEPITARLQKCQQQTRKLLLVYNSCLKAAESTAGQNLISRKQLGLTSESKKTHDQILQEKFGWELKAIHGKGLYVYPYSKKKS